MRFKIKGIHKPHIGECKNETEEQLIFGIVSSELIGVNVNS
jgi:hypothetical protein